MTGNPCFEYGKLTGNRNLTLERKEEVRLPARVWSDPSYAEESLEKLVKYYLDYLRGRSTPTSGETVEKYRKSMLSFMRSLERNGDPLVLGSVTPTTVNRWVKEQRDRGLSEDGIASRLSTVKTFTNKYVFHELELATADLLDKVQRIQPPLKPFPRLTDEEQQRLLDTFDKPTYEDTRDTAFIACLLATGRRLSEILEMTMDELNMLSGEFTVTAKGGDIQIGKLSPNALRYVKRYLRDRPRKVVSNRVWLTAEGNPLSFWGAQSIFRRLKKRSGIGRIHAHLLRHHFAQVALEKGAERAAVQDMLGHKSDAMTRRYAGSVRQQTAAKMMPQFSPL